MRSVMLCMAILALAAVPAQAQDFFKGLGLEFAGNGDVFKAGAFFAPTPRIQVGAEFGYYDGLKEDIKPGFSAEIVAKYFALEKTELDLYIMKVPTSGFVGLGLGGLWANDKPFDDIASARAGFVFGDGPIQIGVEYICEWSNLMWQGTANPNNIVLGTIAYRFGKAEAQ